MSDCMEKLVTPACPECHGKGYVRLLPDEADRMEPDDCPTCCKRWDDAHSAPNQAVIYNRLAALEAEHAKDRARIERLERALSFWHELHESTTPMSKRPVANKGFWSRLDAIRDELAKIDRDQKEGG